MHILATVIVGVILAHVIMGMLRNLSGCLFVLLLILLIGALLGH